MPYWLIIWIVALPLMWGVLFHLLALPEFVKYTADVAWVCLLFFMLSGSRIHIEKKIVPLVLIGVGFFLYSLILYLLNYQSLLYFLWGMRNNFRFYILFFAVTLYVRDRDIDRLFGFLDILFWINFPITLVQYFSLGFERDDLGGIFGTNVGVNSFTILFFTIVLSRSLLRYMEREESFWVCGAKCATALFISALAELKFFFVFFLIILIMATLLTSFSWRKFFVFLVCALLVSVASSLLVSLFGFEDFMSFESVWKNATQAHYSSDKTVNRLSAIPTLANTVVPNWDDRVFGMGLGNCDTSSFAIFNTPFFQVHGYLRYTYFSIAFLFLEVGYVGLLLYVAFFTVCAVLIWNRIRRGRCNPMHGRIALIMAVLAHILVVYNAVLRTEAGYLVFLILASAFLEREEDDPEWDADSSDDPIDLQQPLVPTDNCEYISDNSVPKEV
jgi:hypothetical protein